MFNYLITFSQYIKLFCNISLFSYIYKYFFDNCNDKIQITTKNKKKNAIKSKITLSLMYFTLLTVIYFTISLRFLITILCVFGLSSLLLLDKFDPTSISILTKYDNHKTLRLGWKVFYTFINLVFMCLEPLHKQMTNKFKYYYKKAKKFIMNKLSENKDNGDMDIMNLLFKNDNIDKNIDENNIQEHIKHETNNKINREVLSSTMSDYVMNNNITANQKKNLLNNKENEINDDINVNDIINKIINLRSDETTEEIKEIKEIKEITTNESKTTQDNEETVSKKTLNKEDHDQNHIEDHREEVGEDDGEEVGEDKMQEMMLILNKMNEIFNSDINEEQ